ncbi:MAG: hypothetical protein WB870_14685 [Gallionellaceae bacterium]
MPAYEDAEHRATPMPVRAVDLCRYVWRGAREKLHFIENESRFYNAHP